MLAALLHIHGDDVRMENVYFWSAVLIALTPIIVFGGVGVWLFRKYWRERHTREPGAGGGD